MGSASRINETGLQLYPVSKYDLAKIFISFDVFSGSERWKEKCFRSKISVKKYLKSEYLGMEINQLFASFSWVIPSKKSPNSRG
ncbi:hypothetical protein MTR67_026749 [Solanum verrucosum]|uniref:DUF7081 domain-containing protein n=1 Tax=Solanum verrucosum TaxID=315347 RepID=A0AAF0R8C4_SOLVR|nr:hypothetical protein MTR67_026749 [Solanum verrucosum]